MLKLLLSSGLMALGLVSCGGGGGGGLVPPPLAVLATSFENKNTISFDQPQVTGVSNAVAASLTLGDFSQTGEYSAFVVSLQTAGQPTAGFYKRSGASWSEISGLISGDKKVCTDVRQAITADFNKDSKPDVYVVCGGSVKQVFFMSKGTVYERQESPFTLTDSWGAAAGDIDGDGDVDLVLTDNGFTYAYLNDGSQQGALSFPVSASPGRVPTAASGTNPANVNFPTLHRKVFLLPRDGGYPDLIIGGDGAVNNQTMLLLKNQYAAGQAGFYYANSDSTSTYNNFEQYLGNNTSFRPFDVVATSQFLYVLAKNYAVSSLPVPNPASAVVLRYELPSRNSPSTSIINLISASGVTNVQSEAVVTSLTHVSSDDIPIQIKPVSGRLVSFDGACNTPSSRCSFSATAP